MTNRSRRTAADRAEARRRARLAAQGREEELADDEEELPAREDVRGRPAGGSFLTRLFPPAPPLPGKGDPLAGFTYTGPLRGVAAGLYLLAWNPVPWLGMAEVWAVSRLIIELGPIFGSLAGIIASLVGFGALIAAGWIGWQRPWLFGLVASIVGVLLYAGIFAGLTIGAPTDGTPGQWFAALTYREAIGLQPLFGAMAGWYGGYLRRRMAAASGSDAAQRRRR